ncbi:MAG: hypothetical protein EA356_17080 [Geminicoccaceae bacterium]|nr:MAG: hypothetical protein EA356_17080 [Geminicoccaceae bacterium]
MLNPPDWLQHLVRLGFLVLLGLVVALVMPWHVSNYQLTQWVTFGEPTLMMRALPSLLTWAFFDFPVSKADLFILFFFTVLAFNFIWALVIWLSLRSLPTLPFVTIGLLAFTGVWFSINNALLPNTDPLMYLPAALGLLAYLVVGPSVWLLPVTWLLAAVSLYVHPGAVFSAIPLLVVAPVLLHARGAWSWRTVGLLTTSLVVIGSIVVTAARFDPPRPSDAEFPSVIAAELAAIQARADFRLGQLAAVNKFRNLDDVLGQTVRGDREFHGIRMASPRWYYALPSAAFLIVKIALLLALLSWNGLRTALAVWNPWQRLLALGVVLAPLPLFVLGLDYQRWIGFVDFNLTVIVLLLFYQTQRAGQALVLNTAVLPWIGNLLFFQLLVAIAATRFVVG